MRHSLLALLLTVGSLAFSQSVTITGTVVDPSNNVYQMGSGRATLVSGNDGQQQWLINTTQPVKSPLPIFQLDATGKFSMQVTNTSMIQPAAALPRWQFSFCSAPPPACSPQVCFNVPPLSLAVNQDISVQIKAASVPLPPSCAGGGGGGGGLTPCGVLNDVQLYGTTTVLGCDTSIFTEIPASHTVFIGTGATPGNLEASNQVRTTNPSISGEIDLGAATLDSAVGAGVLGLAANPSTVALRLIFPTGPGTDGYFLKQNSKSGTDVYLDWTNPASLYANYQHNDILVAAQPALNFLDSGSSIFTVTNDAGNSRVNVSVTGVVAGFPFGGDGSDGAVVADGAATVNCLGAPTTFVYTVTRDCYFTTLQVNDGVTVQANNYRIFALTSITVGQGASGVISNSGQDATNGTDAVNSGAGTQGNGGLVSDPGGVGFLDDMMPDPFQAITAPQGKVGVNGGTGAGSNGQNGIASASYACVNTAWYMRTTANPAGANGGNGGDVGGTLGGTGGTGAVSTGTQVVTKQMREPISVLSGTDLSTNLARHIFCPGDQPGSSGSGAAGAGDGSNKGGGGGGSGGTGGAGGILILSSPSITIAAGASVQSNGGNGGNGGKGGHAEPANCSASTAAGGGGGAGSPGGQGGIIGLIYHALTNNGSLTVDGGIGGTGGAGGTGCDSNDGTAGGNASNGMDGVIIQLPI